jgi:hypothetical protein
MNPIKSVSIQLCDEPLLTIHCDGRVTASDKLKPEETARLALDELRKQWLNDAQAVKIRELKVQIERLDKWKQSALEIEREWDANAIATLLGAKLGESHRKVIQREVPKLLTRIKRLEEALGLVVPHCSWVHHSKKHQHKYGEPCPVVALIEKAKKAK